jgi:hypothetical protein
MRKFKDRQFTAHFNRLTLLALVAVMLTALGLIAFQVQSRSRSEDAQLIERFKTRSLAIDNLIVSVTEQLNILQIGAEGHFQDPARERSLLFRALAPTEPPFFALDRVPAPYTEATVGNLTGIGDASRLPPDLVDELEMALGLNSLLHGIQQNIPNAAWVYYTSARRFINIVPWVPSSKARFTEAFYAKPFYQLGLPQNNPRREIRWTPMYVDAYGKGMMVTATKPVYRQDRFLGTVSIDITLDELTRYVRDYAEARGQLMIVNEQGELIAHPTRTSSDAREVIRFKDTLPAPLQARIDGLLAADAMKPLRVERHLVVWQGLKHAPWKVVYVAEMPSPVMNVLEKAGWVIPVLLGALTIMLITTRALTFREFIHPAESLVRHIDLESRDEPSEVGRHPRQWRPWFEVVSAAFRQNRTLLEEIRQKNEQLTDLNISLERYTPRFILLLSLHGGRGATTVGQWVADTLARKEAAKPNAKPTVYLEYPQPEPLGAELALDPADAVHAHPNGYDLWTAYQLGQVPASGVSSLLMAKLLDRYGNVVIGARLPEEPEAHGGFVEQMLEPMLRYAKAVVVLVAPDEVDDPATRQLVRQLQKGVRQDQAQVCVMSSPRKPGDEPVEGADFAMPWLGDAGCVTKDRYDCPAPAREVIDTLVDRIERVHQVSAFIPTTTGVDRPIDTRDHVERTLTFFTQRFGGATASLAHGAWNSDKAGVVSEQVHLVMSHTTKEGLDRHLDEVIEHMKQIKRELAQEAMAIEIDRKLMLL